MSGIEFTLVVSLLVWICTIDIKLYIRAMGEVLYDMWIRLDPPPERIFYISTANEKRLKK